MSKLEDLFAQLWVEKYPNVDLISQFKTIPKRRFRVDFAHLRSKVAIEIQGGRWLKGGHTTGKGMYADCEKAVLSASLGWLVLPIVDQMINDDYLEIIYNIIKLRETSNVGISLLSETTPGRTKTGKSLQNRRRNRSKIA